MALSSAWLGLAEAAQELLVLRAGVEQGFKLGRYSRDETGDRVEGLEHVSASAQATRRKNCWGVAATSRAVGIACQRSGRRRCVGRSTRIPDRARRPRRRWLPDVLTHEIRESVVHESQAVGGDDGLGEGVDLLAADLLLDVGGEQSRGQPRVLRLLDDERRGGLDGELVQLACGGAVVEPADGLRGHPQGVDVGEPRRSTG